MLQRLPVSDVLNIMNSIEHIDDLLEAAVIVRRMSDNMIKDFMVEAPNGFHCVVRGSFQTLRWGWVMPEDVNQVKDVTSV
jgi:hypothetical protein